MGYLISALTVLGILALVLLYAYDPDRSQIEGEYWKLKAEEWTKDAEERP